MSRAPKTLPPRLVLCHTGNTTKQHFKHHPGETMTKLAQLIRLVEGLDATGPDHLAVKEVKQLAKELEAQS